MVSESHKQLLLVEDDEHLAAVIAEYLEMHGFSVSIESRGDRAVKRIIATRPELVILDIMLPGKDGFAICREIRPEYDGPVLMLTARSEEMDQLVGLELGADDYIAKPVQPRLLLARIHAVLRRMHGGRALSSRESVLSFSDLHIDLATREVRLGEEFPELTTAEFDLLALLATHAGQVLDRDYLSQKIKGIEYDGIDRSIDLAISRLRRKIGDDPQRPRRIKTIRARGYLFAGNVRC